VIDTVTDTAYGIDTQAPASSLGHHPFASIFPGTAVTRPPGTDWARISNSGVHGARNVFRVLWPVYTSSMDGVSPTFRLLLFLGLGSPCAQTRRQTGNEEIAVKCTSSCPG